MTSVWARAIFIIICTTISSGGFWAYLRSRDKKRHALARLTMGLAYDRVTTLGMQYIKRGWITKDELEEFQRYFYEPYVALGGNGVAKRIMRDVIRLPLRSHDAYPEIFRNQDHEGFVNNVRLVAPTGSYAGEEADSE